MLMTFDESINACKNIYGWEFVTSFSIGGFEWMGFSKESLNKMIIISSQKSTILDCNNGKLENCIIEYDEEELIAICDKLLNEQILIAGQYGGELPETTKQGEQVLIQETSEHIRTVTFIYNKEKKIKIFENYGPYICGFSYDGNYFMIVDDAGIIVLKRCCSIPVYRA